MVKVNELKGIDFSNKYYDPSEPFGIKNDFFEFHSEPNEWKMLGCNFRSDCYNVEYSTSDISVFNNFNKSFNQMLINDYKISLMKNIFSAYDNIDFKRLLIDFTENVNPEWLYNYEENYDLLVTYYKQILMDFHVDATDDELDELFYLINSHDLEAHASCDDYDLDSLLEENIEDTENIKFRLAYVLYLQLVNSEHNNRMDKNHFFDADCDPDELLMHTFHPINITLPVGIIKKVAISKNHIVDGKGIGVLRHKSSAGELKNVAEKYGLKKSGTKKVLKERIEENLTPNEINEEFNGSRFILTEDGERFLNKFDNYNFDYFQSLPESFESVDLEILCQENPQYPIEDIIYAIVMEDWCTIRNPECFTESSLDSLMFFIHQKRYLLAKAFEKDFPDKAATLYETCLKEKYNPHYAEKYAKLCKKNNIVSKI